MKLHKYPGTFYKSLLLIVALQLMACATISQPQATEHSLAKDNLITNNISTFYFTMGETALVQGDLELALQLYRRADKEAPRNIFIKEVILEILEMRMQIDAEAQALLIALGEDYLERDLSSEKILTALAAAYRQTEQYEKLQQILQQQLEEYPSMRTYLLNYYFIKERFQREDRQLLQLALQQDWQNINQVISIAFELDDEKLLAATLEKTYEKWTNQQLSQADIRAQLEGEHPEQVFVDLIESALFAGEKIIDEIARYYLATLNRNGEYDKILQAAPYFANRRSVIINELIFSAAVELQEWSLVATLGHRSMAASSILSPQYKLLNTALAEARLGNISAALNLISQVDNLSEISFILNYIYPKISAEGQKAIYKQVEQVWLEPEMVDFVRLRLQIIAEDLAIAQQSLDNLPREFILQNQLTYLIAADYLALEEIEAALEILMLDPELEDANEFIGQYYLQQEQYQKSIDYLQKMIASSEKAPQNYYLIASVAAQKLQKNNLALEILRAGLEAYPDSSNMLNSLGYTIADLNLIEYFVQAEKYLLQAVQLEPDSSMIWDSLAWLYYRQGRYQEALEIFLEHFSQDIENSEIAYHLGAVHLKLGNLDEAKKYLIQTLILQNNEQAMQAAEQLLEEHFQSIEASNK